MLPVPDALAGFYLACFFVGLIFVAASLFLGLGHGDVGGHAGGLDHAGGIDGSSGDAGGTDGVAGSHIGGHSGPGDSSHAGVHISPFNVSTIMAFLAWFGGAGYMIHVYAGVVAFVSVAASMVAGLVGGAAVFYFLSKVLLSSEQVLNPEDYRLEGTVAKVTMPLGPNRIGEIVYTKGGSRRSEGARSVDEAPIERDTEVVIVKYERGIAYVEPWKSYIARG